MTEAVDELLEAMKLSWMNQLFERIKWDRESPESQKLISQFKEILSKVGGDGIAEFAKHYPAELNIITGANPENHGGAVQLMLDGKSVEVIDGRRRKSEKSNISSNDMNNKLREMNVLPSLDVLSQYNDVKIASEDFMQVALYRDDGLELSRKISVFDARVMDAIGNIWSERRLTDKQDAYMTTWDIAKEMGSIYKKCSYEFYNKIEESIKRLESTKVKIKMKDKKIAARYGITDVLGEGRLLNLFKITIIKKNTSYDGYHLLFPPIAYLYSLKRRYFVQVPKKCLAGITGAAGDIAYYLISQMGRGGAAVCLKLETIMNECGITGGGRMQKTRARQKVQTICEKWKGEGFINGYSIEDDTITIQKQAGAVELSTGGE